MEIFKTVRKTDSVDWLPNKNKDLFFFNASMKGVSRPQYSFESLETRKKMIF